MMRGAVFPGVVDAVVYDRFARNIALKMVEGEVSGVKKAWLSDFQAPWRFGVDYLDGYLYLYCDILGILGIVLT